MAKDPKAEIVVRLTLKALGAIEKARELSELKAGCHLFANGVRASTRGFRGTSVLLLAVLLLVVCTPLVWAVSSTIRRAMRTGSKRAGSKAQGSGE